MTGLSEDRQLPAVRHGDYAAPSLPLHSFHAPESSLGSRTPASQPRQVANAPKGPDGDVEAIRAWIVSLTCRIECVAECMLMH
jgi:hypothetical protein